MPSNSNKLYRNKDWLYDQYIKQEKSTRDIAKEFGYGKSAIGEWLIKHNIKSRTKKEALNLKYKAKYKNKQWLEDQYINKQKSSLEIAKECDCSDRAICVWLKKFGIKIRSLSESAIGRKASKETKKKMSENRKGKKHWNWNGGRTIDNDGYIHTYKPDHPRADSHGYVREHILAAEEYYGRYITKDEVIHHIDGNKLNNKPENMYVCGCFSDHRDIHTRLQDLAFQLIQRGIIKFDRKKGLYYYEM